MMDMVKSSVVLFFRGKLLAEPRKVINQAATGAAVTAVLFVVLAKFGVPVVAAAAIAGLIGGGLQPYLFKDLRFH